MRKKQENIRESAIAETRAVLESKGWEALSMRDIADKCGIAVGTLYNYFPSKEQLTGCVVLEDWTAAYSGMLRAVTEADSFLRGYRSIYDSMCAFTEAHRYLSSFNRKGNHTAYSFRERHLRLRGEIEELVQLLQKRFVCGLEPAVVTFLAETVLSFSVRQYSYAEIMPAVIKLVRE